MDTVIEISDLLNNHMIGMEDDDVKGRKWCVSVSPLGGRGVFTTRDLEMGELIYQEKPLLLGLTGRVEAKVNVCVQCYKFLNMENSLCKNGCSLPICEDCIDAHTDECKLFQSWNPIKPTVINRYRIRVLTVARGLFLNKQKKDLLLALQANKDTDYRKEVRKASAFFANFPNDEETLEYFYKIVQVLNTNAFEVVNQNEAHETGLRGLYPLASVMNHQCTPNTCHIFSDNNVMLVKATRFIPKGAEIYTTYTKILWSNMTRRLFLNMTKQFSCCCFRCIDPTENGSYISALLCRTNNCTGWIIPVDCLLVTSSWRCLECNTIYQSGKISKWQDFILGLINSKVKNSSIHEIINFIDEKSPKFCPPSNQFILEMKLSIIWKANKTDEKLSDCDIRRILQYCYDILQILEKLGAGDCTMKKLIHEEMKKLNIMSENIKRDCCG